MRYHGIAIFAYGAVWEPPTGGRHQTHTMKHLSNYFSGDRAKKNRRKISHNKSGMCCINWTLSKIFPAGYTEKNVRKSGLQRPRSSGIGVGRELL